MALNDFYGYGGGDDDGLGWLRSLYGGQGSPGTGVGGLEGEILPPNAGELPGPSQAPPSSVNVNGFVNPQLTGRNFGPAATPSGALPAGVPGGIPTGRMLTPQPVNPLGALGALARGNPWVRAAGQIMDTTPAETGELPLSLAPSGESPFRPPNLAARTPIPPPVTASAAYSGGGIGSDARFPLTYSGGGIGSDARFPLAAPQGTPSQTPTPTRRAAAPASPSSASPPSSRFGTVQYNVAGTPGAYNLPASAVSQGVGGTGRGGLSTPIYTALNLGGGGGGGNGAPPAGANPNVPARAAQPVMGALSGGQTVAPWGMGPLQQGFGWPSKTPYGPPLPPRAARARMLQPGYYG